jgi:hypothetical protein
MEKFDVKRLALVLAVQAEIEGMKVANSVKEANGFSPAYGHDHFFDKAEELRILASKHDNQL